MAKDDQEREWQRSLAEHAAAVLRSAIAWGPGSQIRGDRDGDRNSGPSVEIRGPDGEWRRYYVRLTEVRT